MKININLINDEDMRIIRALAKKNNMGVAEFGRLIAKVSTDGFQQHIRFNDTEYDDLQIKAEKCNLSMSAYCCRAILDFSKDNMERVEIANINERRGNEKRNRRICITFPDKSVYKKCYDYAKKSGISAASLIRYCVSNFKD